MFTIIRIKGTNSFSKNIYDKRKVPIVLMEKK